ncbi:MAG TPA: anthranilate phosphoribosyltransferase [Fimbriiglobus sp.]
MEPFRPSWFDAAYASLLAGRELAPEPVTAAIRDFVAGRVPDTLGAALLTAWRVKGETAAEIAAAAVALREQMVRLVPVSGPVLDTCGTGGDAAGTFNISTAAAIVCAAAGVPVVKHGNRAVSGKTGSADVLREFGVPIETGPDWAQQCLDRFGFAFCYAPQFHPGLAHVAALRKALGVRTLFNLLGPLANPAAADFHLLGVGSPALLDTLAEAVARLGTRRAVLVSGADGLDEVTLSGPTNVRIVEGDEFAVHTWTPADFGLDPCPADAVRVESARESAAVIRRVLDGEDSPAARYVWVNAAAGLFAAGAATRLTDGVAAARDAVRSGKAAAMLDNLTNSRT